MRNTLAGLFVVCSVAVAGLPPVVLARPGGTERGDRTWQGGWPASTVATGGMEGGADGPEHDNPWGRQPDPNHEGPIR
jgi:hypothetical protein